LRKPKKPHIANNTLIVSSFPFLKRDCVATRLGSARLGSARLGSARLEGPAAMIANLPFRTDAVEKLRSRRWEDLLTAPQ
jgi:hypothetical protein